MKNLLLQSVILLFLLAACSTIPSDVRTALEQAGINRPELEKVIEHYKTTGERQKLKAAYFLIGNMPGKYAEYYSYNEQAYEMFLRSKDANKRNNRVAYEDSLAEQIDMLKDLSGGWVPLIVKDIDVISSKYLIENIDLAFKVWKEPWVCHFTFDEFCEYILPYRILHEPISNWRKYLYEKYSWVKDSLKNVSDTEELVLYLNDLIAKDFWTLDELDIPFVPVPLLEKAKAGGCDQRYVLMVSLLRAMGVPAMMDYAPQNNNTFKDHKWVVYLDSLHRYRPCDAGRIRGKIFLKDNLKCAFPAGLVLPLADGFGSNVFRYTYAINRNSLAEETENKHILPPFFRNSCIKNVSDQYIFDMHPVTYDLPSELQLKDNETVYLAVFGYGNHIREADYAQVKNNKVSFEHIGSGIVYLVCAYGRERLVPISYPILLRDSLGTTEILKPDTVRKQKMILTRKCKPSLLMQGFAESMIGGRFEGSNTPDFKHPETLFTIKEAPYSLTEVDINGMSSYRYVRYTSVHSGIFAAEIQFWGTDKEGKDVMLKGKPIVHFGSDSIPNSEPKNAFDNNIRTNFNAPSHSWIGLDLRSPLSIKKVKYLPRNNFNVIEVGNKYELMYYNGRWVSLGIQTATSQYLEYENAPTHALFLLRNLTQGKEERIFTYENGKQVWW